MPFDQRSEGPGGPPGGWWILFEPELHLGADILVPDLTGWRRERMPVLTNVPYFELAPDWVCEVVSPSTGRIDRVSKMPAYAREQVPYDGGYTYGGEESVQAEPFEALELDMNRDMNRWWLEAESVGG